MATNYPGSLDTGTQQPSPSASTEMDDSGFEHDAVHTNHSGAIIALETKVGTGDSNAVANSVLAGTGSGTSGWSTAPSLAGLTVDTDTLHVDATNNRVGVGTTTPSTDLEVAGDVVIQDVSPKLTIKDNNNTGTSNAILEFTDQTDAILARLFMGAGNDLYIDVGSADFVMTDTGRLGVGTTSPTQALEVNGTGRFINNVNSPGTYSTTNSGAANMVILSNGTFYRSTSSLKYKTDVETMGDEYADALLELRPVWFRSLSDSDPDSWGYWGFIAEEVAEIDPRLVHWGVPDDFEWQYDEDGEMVDAAIEDLTEPEGVQYDRMVPHLVNLVKRQQATIEALEQRIAALEP